MNESDPTASPEAEAVKTVQMLESSHDLLQYQVEGWCFWPLLRFDAAMALARLPFSGKDRFSRLGQFWIALKDMPHLIKLSQKKFVVKSYSSARLVQEGGLKKDVFFDDLLEGQESVLRIESANSRRMFKERNLAKFPASFTSLPVDFTAGILSLLPGLSPDFSEMTAKICTALSADPRLAGFTPRKILQKTRYFYWGMKLYGILLKKTRPEKVLVADPGEYLICAAAKSLGIPVIEFQHGLASRDYNCFYSWTGYAHTYKNRMPIPDKVCLFGQYWKDELLATGFWKEELTVTGSILVDSFYRLLEREKKEVCSILLTSQGLDRENLITLIQDFSIIARQDGSIKFHLFIKMHPVYDRDKSDFINDFEDDPAITILEASEPPSTFELLAKSNLHLSISSACHYDALGMGVPTVILGLKTCESVFHLHEEGNAFLAHNGWELFEIIRNWKVYTVSDTTRDYFYCSGALENARKEIGLT